MNGVICLGEALIDFIPLDKENLTYQKSPGGAPANVAVGIARLGGKVSFVGKVGNDVLGHFMKETLRANQVDISHMNLTDQARTGLVFVTLAPSGERSFSFFVQPRADQFLMEQDISAPIFEKNKILHIGSISLISEPSASATRKAVKLAKQDGLLLSYDPNLRLSLWGKEEIARETIISMLAETDILKISDEELFFITGEEETAKALQKLDAYKIPLILVTLGADGSLIYFNGVQKKVPARKVDAVDTTGAGDAYVSAILYQINETTTALEEMYMEELTQIVSFASISGALAASTMGAMTSLPTLQMVQEMKSSR